MSETKLHFCTPETDTSQPLPFAEGGIKAGFPSPAQDRLTESIDLNELMVRSKESTFYARIDGDSMEDAGICNGDIVIIDKSLEVRSGDYVAAYVDGEFTLKRFEMNTDMKSGRLIPANKRFSPITVDADNDFRVWGVVTGLVRKIR